MMKHLVTYIFISALAAVLAACGDRVAERSPSAPHIFPDYAGVTVPVNIAPLNFRLDGFEGRARARLEAGAEHITVSTRDGAFRLPQRGWRRLCTAAVAVGGDISVTVEARDGDGVWRRYAPFVIRVSEDEIDPYMVYRLIEPGYETWGEMGIYQRCLETFREEPVIETSSAGYGCINCHTFRSQDPDMMLFHMRQTHAGTMLLREGRIERLNTATDSTISSTVYPSWHPSGRYIAFSVNATKLITLPDESNRVEVFDSASDVVVYDTERHELYSVPELMRGDRFETFPSFSPAGDKLYFCTADSVEMPARYKEARYSLCSIGFDAASGRLGRDVDTLCNARTTGRSVSFPRVSPDGAFMLYALSDYGTFSIWHRDADLRMIDLRSGREVETSAVNSPEAESYHSWSSNSRWILFNSRRVDGLYTHVYMAHVSDDGTLSKPFLLPQRDPDFYRTFMKSYNIPEFVRGRVTVPERRIVSAAERQPAVTVSFRMQE